MDMITHNVEVINHVPWYYLYNSSNWYLIHNPLFHNSTTGHEWFNNHVNEMTHIKYMYIKHIAPHPTHVLLQPMFNGRLNDIIMYIYVTLILSWKYKINGSQMMPYGKL